MKFNYEWAMVLIVIIVMLLLIFSLNTKSKCYEGCNNQGYSTGACTNMAEDQTCESKFDYNSISKDLCDQKNPGGFYNACCCQ